jgi:hypothetical protein
VGGRTEELIMTTERCTCTHKRRFTCLLHNLPTRHTSNSSEWKRAFALFLFYFLTHIYSQRVRIEREKWLLEILSLRCRLETDYGNTCPSKASRRSFILAALLPLLLSSPVVDLQVGITASSLSNSCQPHPLNWTAWSLYRSIS